MIQVLWFLLGIIFFINKVFYTGGNMFRRYRKIEYVFIVLIAGLMILSCQNGKSIGGKKGSAERTVQRALSWVYGHPAHFADGAFIELSEEIIMFYILSNNTDDPLQKNSYIREIQKRLELIKSKNDFRLQPPEYTMFLAIASISEKLGLKTIDFRKTIELEMLSNPMAFPPHITTNIWNTVFLERMGYNPSHSLNEIMPNSTLAREVRQRLLFRHVKAPFDQMYLDPISITTYDITHEIFALTDFGELPPPPVITENQAFFSELFDSIIEWAMIAKHIDVLAEGIMCVKILDLENVPSLDRGIEFIISNQKGDGSFGVTNPGRPNVYRHGILVSIMALTLP